MSKAKKAQRAPRLLWVDALRGFAIVLMVVFHFCYDLRYFGYVDWDVPNGPNWWPFRYFILTLFIFTVGVSLSLAHKNQFKKAAFNKRFLKLLVSSIIITVMSLFLFPNSWIYFGILHFIAVATLFGIPLVRYPRLSLVLGLFILCGFWFGVLKSYWPYVWLSQWLPKHTEDFVPLIPWLGVMFLGIGFAGFIRVSSMSKFDLPKNKLTLPMANMGKHGLIIYLIHQPILFAGFMLVNFFFGK